VYPCATTLCSIMVNTCLTLTLPPAPPPPPSPGLSPPLPITPGTCCGGAWHAKDTGREPCCCPGGGVEGRRGSNNKADRVDQYGAVRGGAGGLMRNRGVGEKEDGQGRTEVGRERESTETGGGGGAA
jgi:hypothetical protein